MYIRIYVSVYVCMYVCMYVHKFCLQTKPPIPSSPCNHIANLHKILFLHRERANPRVPPGSDRKKKIQDPPLKRLKDMLLIYYILYRYYMSGSVITWGKRKKSSAIQ